MYPEDSLPHSQDPTNCLYLEPHRFNLWSSSHFLGLILVLSSHLCLGLPSSLFLGLTTKTCTHLSPMFVTCATNRCPFVDKIRPLDYQRDIMNTVNVQYALINDFISSTFRHFSFVSDTLHNRTPAFYRTRFHHLQIVYSFIYLKMFNRINLITLTFVRQCGLVWCFCTCTTEGHFIVRCFVMKLIFTKNNLVLQDCRQVSTKKKKKKNYNVTFSDSVHYLET
jgi:hypothetical protein